MEERIKQAMLGAALWAQYACEDYDIVLLLPQRDDRLNNIMCDCLSRRLRADRAMGRENNEQPSAMVLCVEPLDNTDDVVSRVISEDMADSLMTLYCLYEFTDKLIIGSFELPYGRRLQNFIDCGVTTEQRLADGVIFGRR